MRTAALVVLLAGLVVGSAGALASAKCVRTPSAFDYTAYGELVRRQLAEIATLPGDVVIVAGQYHDGGNTLHPALLVSRNGGRNWSAVELRWSGTGVHFLRTQGEATVWAMVSFRQEGLAKAQYLLRSGDGGASWCALPLGDLETRNTVESLRFFDERHGIAVFSNMPLNETKRTVYVTRDGGDSWRRLWRAEENPDVETRPRYPGVAEPPPPHAPLWTRNLGYQKITGLLRLVERGGRHAIDFFDYYQDGAGWQQRSTIHRNYRNVDGRLEESQE